MSELEDVYLHHVPAEDLAAHDPADLARAVASHRELAATRPAGQALVRVHTPSRDHDGWSVGHTVVEVVTDDMPFLVDSVTAELTRQGRGIHLVVHPILRVRRDPDGSLRELLGDGTSPGEPGTVAESWIHVQVDREVDPAERDVVRTEVLRVLRDVRNAVEDWRPMRATALRIADELKEPPAGLDQAEADEARELLIWLARERFTFLGYREYALEAVDGEEVLRTVPGSGLGILRSDPQTSASFAKLPPRARALARLPRLLILTKANSRSTVHRPVYLDYVGVKTFDAEGNVTGERRFLGLLTSAAYTESIERIPVLRRKAAEALRRSGFTPASHSGKDLLQVLETYPRDELFQVPVEDLLPVVRSVSHLQERRRLRLFLRPDDYGRFISVMVFFPRDRYTTAVRLSMERLLRTAFRATSVDYSTRVSESVLARLHFVVRTAPGMDIPEVDPARLEAELVEATRSWIDDLAEALVRLVGEAEAARLQRLYPDAFPPAYKEDVPPEEAVADLQRIEAMSADTALVMHLYAPPSAVPGERRLKIFRDGPVSLSDVLPVLAQMGVEVVDERPYELQRGDGKLTYLYDFGLRYDPSLPATDNSAEKFQATFAAVWSGAAENDGFNTLVLAAGMSWRQAMVLRAYARYLRQVGWNYSQDYVEQCLVANVGIARMLIRLFHAQNDPSVAGSGSEVGSALVEEIEGALDAVRSLDQDRILRSFLGAVRATVRTNYFQHDSAGRPHHYVSFKLDPALVPDLPAPRPHAEIWVYSPRVEGVHLRFGAVARGGLRWSDRREDFRTEVLGLVKAQMVKNAVIVPVGAKGGFVVKRAPDPATDREGWLAEGIACYRMFINALLDLTDNRVSRGGVSTVLPPANVVRRDGDDSYLVVAADKGTATFSDIANEVAHDYGFWLGDAFASGGSVGYDHKVMGITARGAWVSVQRHFRELGVDVQTDDVTAVGIGDMSGDVFGNGMLLSEHIRLVAAFDHRHVFLDPSPDAAASFAERGRLYDLPRSSWADYDPALISAGGGVHSRTAKSVPITPQVRRVLGLPDDVLSLTPARLINAILTAPVDLFWNGGIGTYVKASQESHADVGDKANDVIRVDGSALRARVVSEGGNLGLTQLGRIEAALAGVRINTDAIDNSAGVDCSDHEVNIKILLDAAVRDGALDAADRVGLLASMTDDVAALVLRDNYDQNVLLGTARGQAPSMLPAHERLMSALSKRGQLDRALEFLPTGKETARRAAAGGGLTSPELAVLMAYVKIRLTDELLASPLPDDPWYRRALRAYFPGELVRRFDDRLDAHPLRREIVTTSVVNDLVNQAGMTFVFRVAEETGASSLEVARAYTVAREIFDFGSYWSAVEALDGAVQTAIQQTLRIEGRRLIDRSVRWLLQSRRSSIDVTTELERFGDGVRDLAPLVPEMLQGAEAARLHARVAELVGDGVPEPLAVRSAALLDSFSLLDVVGAARTSGLGAREVAGVYFALSDRFSVDLLLTRISALPRADRWQSLARSALRYDLYAALSGLTRDVLTSTSGTDAAARVTDWETANAEGLERARVTYDEILAGGTHDLATLSVALRTIRTLLAA